MTTNIQIERAGKVYDFSAIPEQTTKAMLSRGLTHFFGSELSSKVIAMVAKFEKDEKRKPTDDEIATIKANALASMQKAFDEGTVGTARGPKVDPLEAEMDRLAEIRVDAILRANKLPDGKAMWSGKARPKDEQEFVFGSAPPVTFATLVERQLAKHGETIKAEAEKNLAAAKKRREAEAAKVAKLTEGDVAEALGL